MCYQNKFTSVLSKYVVNFAIQGRFFEIKTSKMGRDFLDTCIPWYSYGSPSSFHTYTKKYKHPMYDVKMTSLLQILPT